MGVLTYESEVITAIPPAKMFKACILDGENLIPKILPQAFKSIEYIEGNGEPGSIKKVTFGEGKRVKTVCFSSYRKPIKMHEAEGRSSRQRKFCVHLQCD
ncbi:hypothetical protein Godav_013168 [Gossypium davidsonii]|uniref:Bet v I/Major latex protein domain-containing protein n=2 Tax=Gossypium TaxID=3633 RepID=A0A7J8RFP5_GOSDV|nr:hypothetical protein [Gossypium davidsonii]MBA0647759.1 hypothetical protein [Gossypium klotzschianum]